MNKLTSLVAICSLGATMIVAPISAQAQTAKPKKSHHRMAKLAGGVAAYEAAKKTGKARARAGKKKNLAQKHPFVSGMAGAYAAGKIAKHHDKKKAAAGH